MFKRLLVVGVFGAGLVGATCGYPEVVHHEHHSRKSVSRVVMLPAQQPVFYHFRYTALTPSSTTTTTTTVPPTTTTTTEPVPANADGWELVHQCEATAWGMIGSVYSGGLGIANETWDSKGGLAIAPNAGEATPYEQMTFANTIESPPFDDTPAGGCHGW